MKLRRKDSGTVQQSHTSFYSSRLSLEQTLYGFVTQLCYYETQCNNLQTLLLQLRNGTIINDSDVSL